MIRIDKEFESLIPPLSEEEFKQLEENCIREGIRDPLVVWHVPNGDDILIDGHNRWKISAQHAGIPFEIKRMTFDTREEVIAWIIRNQFGRRNLSAYDRSILALKLKPMIAKKAKENERLGGKGSQKSVNHKTDTQKELAKAAGVSHDTIHKVEVIERDGTDDIKEKVRSGDMTINQAWIETKEQERKKVDLSAKAHLEAAEDRHNDFREAKTVSISEVAQDKKDIETIARGRCTEIYNAIKKILFVGASEFDYSIISKKTVSSDTFHRLRGEIVMAIATLERIKEQIGG